VKKYQIIYADCPWSYFNGGVPQGGVDAQYKTMELSDIKELPIHTITDNDCALFFWVTFPMLREGLAVIDSWGFKYKTNAFTWIKTNSNSMGFFFGIGYYTKSNAEICLLATKGDAHSFVKDNSISQMIMTPKTIHSRKPPEVRERIVRLMGDRPRIELFARQKVEGWDCWGNEVESDIEL